MREIRIAQCPVRGSRRRQGLTTSNGSSRLPGRPVAPGCAEIVSFHECSITGLYVSCRTLQFARDASPRRTRAPTGPSTQRTDRGWHARWAFACWPGLIESDGGRLYKTYVGRLARRLRGPGIASFIRFINPHLLPGQMPWKFFELCGIRCGITHLLRQTTCPKNPRVLGPVRRRSDLRSSCDLRSAQPPCPARGKIDRRLWGQSSG